MSTLRSELSELFGRAVILARGAEGDLAAAERALASGDPSLALRHARSVLARVPRSPVALLVAADAAEAAWLDEDACAALEALAAVVPWRAEIWLRLGDARRRAGHLGEAREAWQRAVSSDDAEVASRAARSLAAVDLAAGDPARALAWLERAGDSPEARELRAAALLDRGEVEAAREAAAALGAGGPLDGRRALLVGRLLARTGGDATEALLRAYVLDEPGAARALASYVAGAGARVADVVRPVVLLRDREESALFRAAFAEARGDRTASLAALRSATEAGDADAARALCGLAVDARDAASLALAHRALAGAGIAPPDIEVALARAEAALDRGDPAAALDALDRAGEHPWATSLRARAVGSWTKGSLVIGGVLGELRRAARELDDTPALLATEAVAALAERSARVAIMGEFNAGKSTFVNALLGADIAPTGVLPTTATLHHVVFSPDPFARIAVSGGPDRVVAPERLRGALDEVQRASAIATRVTVGLPLERLRHLELVDTPGFNAPDRTHAAAARDALDEVHLVVWLLDANQPWKGTERAILAEVQAAGVPVRIVANKLDRVSPADRAAVLAHVAAGAVEAGVASPAIAVSARLALAGRLGDAEALAASGWDAVDAFVERELVAGAERLRDGALRRRARRVVGPLLSRARALADAELGEARRESSRRAALRTAATTLGGPSSTLPRAVARALDGARQGLADDLAPLGAGEGDGGAGARAYARERAERRLTLPLAHAITSSSIADADLAAAAAAVVAPSVAAALGGLVAGLARPSDVAAVPNEKLVEAVLPAARDALLRESDRWTAPSRAASPIVLRLAALDAALAEQVTSTP
jgi:small GTP-binding protein